jgi:hypothetical protein
MDNPFLERLPEPLRGKLKLSLAVAGFRVEIATKGPLMKSLFDIVPVAKGKSETLSRTLAPMLDTEEGARKLFNEQPLKTHIYEMDANRALLTDASAAIILIADAAIDRLYQKVGVSLFARGANTYASGIKIAQAISSLANQYKHLGEWLQTSTSMAKDRQVVEALVGDPLKADAAAEFLSHFADYGEFEDALISCADDIVTDGTIPAKGRAGVPVITMRAIDKT